MCADDVITSILRQHAMGDLLLVAALCVDVFVLEDFGNVLWLADEDVPAATEEELHCTVLGEWSFEIFPVEVDLVVVLD